MPTLLFSKCHIFLLFERETPVNQVRSCAMSAASWHKVSKFPRYGGWNNMGSLAAANKAVTFLLPFPGTIPASTPGYTWPA